VVSILEDLQDVLQSEIEKELKEPNRGLALFIDAFSNLEKLAVEIEEVVPSADERGEITTEKVEKSEEDSKDEEEEVNVKSVDLSIDETIDGIKARLKQFRKLEEGAKDQTAQNQLLNKIQEVLVSEINDLEKIKNNAKKEEDDDEDEEEDDDEDEDEKDTKPISEEKVDDELSGLIQGMIDKS
jgi:hypothetical protein